MANGTTAKTAPRAMITASSKDEHVTHAHVVQAAIIAKVIRIYVNIV